jgi:hypothetical protein
MVVKLSTYTLGACVLVGLLQSFTAAAGELGYVIYLQPETVEAQLYPDQNTTVNVTAGFLNTSFSTFTWTAYVQDSAACPMAVSSHSWILLNPQFGQVPVSDLEYQVVVGVQLNSLGLAPGLRNTHVCLITDADVETKLAIPIALEVLDPNFVFEDGFEN